MVLSECWILLILLYLFVLTWMYTRNFILADVLITSCIFIYFLSDIYLRNVKCKLADVSYYIFNKMLFFRFGLKKTHNAFAHVFAPIALEIVNNARDIFEWCFMDSWSTIKWLLYTNAILSIRLNAIYIFFAVRRRWYWNWTTLSSSAFFFF